MSQPRYTLPLAILATILLPISAAFAAEAAASKTPPAPAAKAESKTAGNEKDAAKIPVLLITGDDASAHDWRAMAEATRKVLIDTGRFDVRVSEDPMILDSAAALERYPVIVFTIFATAKSPKLTDRAKENLLNFVREGKGLYIQHLASASYPDWAEFGNLVGRHWVMKTSGHGPRSVFETRIADAAHPITRGMGGFQADDELYAKLQGDAPIHVLVEADSNWSHKTEPLVFTRDYGKGRVVHNALGHDARAIESPQESRLIARGVEWAATGKVAE